MRGVRVLVLCDVPFTLQICSSLNFNETLSYVFMSFSSRWLYGQLYFVLVFIF